MSSRPTNLQPMSKKSLLAKAVHNTTDRIDTTKIDARLQRVSDKILPKSPYLLVVPPTTSHRLSPQQINDLTRGSPFSASETQLQYLSFIPREGNDGLLKAVGNWDNGSGEIMENSSSQSHGMMSQTSSPQHGQPPKKKISLLDYKNTKAAVQSGAKTVAKVNGEQNSQDRSNGTSVPADTATGFEKLQHGQKRSVDAISETKVFKSSDDNIQPPAKKARTSSPLPETTSEGPKPKKHNIINLPPLLSPTLPPSIEDEIAKAYPNAKSGDVNTRHKNTTSVTSSTSEKGSQSTQLSSPNESHTLKPTASSSVSKPGIESSATTHIDKTSSTKAPDPSKRPPDQKQQTSRSKVEDKTFRVNGATSIKSDALSTSAKHESSTSQGPVSKVLKPETKKLVVKLKIPKAVRKNVSRILQMQPRPKKQEQGIISQRSDREAVKEKHGDKIQPSAPDRGRDQPRQDQKARIDKSNDLRANNRDEAKTKRPQGDQEQSSTKGSEKRQRLEDDKDDLEPPKKRQKPPNDLDLKHKPRTPIPPPFKSPALSQQGSAQKSQVSTPMRDLKSVAMRRIESGEGDVKTPQGAVRGGTPNAPNSAERVNRDGRSSSNTSSNTNILNSKAEEITAWKLENKKYMELGRTLKHDALPFLNSRDQNSNGEPDSDALKRGIAIAIETILCYMLAFTAMDEAQRANRKTSDAVGWRSLLPYMNFVMTRTPKFPLLHGLVHQLEAVCRDTIHTLELEKLERDPLPGDEPRPGAHGTEGEKAVDSTAKAMQYKSDYTEFKTRLIENARTAQQMWLQGTAQLSISHCQRSFPETWAKRASVPMAKNREKLVARNYDGEFYLPLGGISSGIEAVRAGWSLLGEWCRQEKVKWEGKLGLGI